LKSLPMKSPRTLKKVYFNKPQQEYMFVGAHTSVVVAGRRLGKTHGFAAPFLLRNAQYMPRSASGIVGTTYQQLLTRTLPGTLQALEHFGYKRDLHYFLGMKPPKTSNFQKPYIEPGSYDHVMSWYNGSISHLISQDRAGTSNSLTLDSLLIDEARFVNYEKLKVETFPALGGFRGYFAHIPWHHSMLILSDMPATQKPAWFENYKDKMDNELISTIQGLVVKIYYLKKEQSKLPTDAREKYIKSLRRDLARFQSIAVYYREWSSIENLEILGKKYFDQMKRDLPPLIFQTSILCRRLRIIKDGFYAALDPKVHYYTAYDNSYLDSLGYNFDKLKEENSLQDGDVDPMKPICIGLDYNANINWLVAGQRDGVKMKVIKSFYVKYERKLKELVQDFCKYYRFHKKREVIYYYDNTAVGTNYAVGEDDFAGTVCDEFARNKWEISRVHIGNPPKHVDKHRMIHQSLSGIKYLLPQFNKENNEALLLAMEHTGIRISTYGFGKDKSGEKLGESEQDLLEHRTDGTDAFDTLWYGMNRFPHEEGEGAMTSSWA